MLCKTAHALDEEARTAAKAQALGIPAQVLDPRATAALDPAVSMDVAGSVFFPKDCHLPPERYLAFLHHELTSLGAEFRWNTEVTSWQTTDSRIRSLQTPAGPVTGDEFVLCGGSWSALSARSLDLHLPLQAGKGYSLTLAQPRQLPSLCAIFTEARVAITPMNGALRVGGTMELAGLNESINLQRVRGIIRSVPRYYPQFREEDFHGIQPWHGLRPCTPDGLPYLGRTARWDNLLCATGHAMMGLSLAPATGLLVAELASGAAPSADLSLFSPDRFSAF
jgi:D-amino-acid dehydrogenase